MSVAKLRCIWGLSFEKEVVDLAHDFLFIRLAQRQGASLKDNLIAIYGPDGIHRDDERLVYPDEQVRGQLLLDPFEGDVGDVLFLHGMQDDIIGECLHV